MKIPVLEASKEPLKPAPRLTRALTSMTAFDSRWYSRELSRRDLKDRVDGLSQNAKPDVDLPMHVGHAFSERYRSKQESPAQTTRARE